MKATIIFIALFVLLQITYSIEIKILKIRSDFENILFKSEKECLVVVYASWDKKNTEIGLDLWEFLKVDYEKDGVDIEMAKFDVINEEDKAPNMNFVKKYVIIYLQ